MGSDKRGAEPVCGLQPEPTFSLSPQWTLEREPHP